MTFRNLPPDEYNKVENMKQRCRPFNQIVINNTISKYLKMIKEEIGKREQIV